MISLVPADRKLLLQMLPLIADYQRFYGMEPDHERNLNFFTDLLEQPELAVQFAALGPNDQVIGFATVYFFPSSLSARTYGMLNDLYTLPEYRSQGVGRLLIRRCQELAKERGLGSLEWLTQKENQTAQRLYDSLPTEKSEWLTYTLKSSPELSV